MVFRHNGTQLCSVCSVCCPYGVPVYCTLQNFKSCQPSSAVVYLILSIFFSVSLPFILFGIRNKDEGMIPAYVNPPYGER